MKQPFSNPHIAKIRRTFRDFLLWKMGYYDDPVRLVPPPSDFCYPSLNKKIDAKEPLVTWVNHSTFLVAVDGFHLLTDPIWSKRCSPLPCIGPKRRHPPGIKLEDLPPIDLVLISHNHYDHLDKKSILALFRRFPKILWIVPQGVKKWFLKLGIDSVIELSWWQEIKIYRNNLKNRNFDKEAPQNACPERAAIAGRQDASEGKRFEVKPTQSKTDSSGCFGIGSSLTVTATPAQHFSGRRGYDLNHTLWAGYVVDFTREKGDNKRLYFVGDTGYNRSDFKQIGEKWQEMDLSLIPIGSYTPRFFMSPVHIGPDNAVQIHKEVGSKLSIGMHWKTFHLSDEPPELPPYELFLALKKEGIDPLQFLAIEPGHVINW